MTRPDGSTYRVVSLEQRKADRTQWLLKRGHAATAAEALAIVEEQARCC